MNIRQCKHCLEQFDISDKSKGWMANHSRWCDKNPKRKTYKNGSAAAVKAMNEAKKKDGVATNQYTKAVLNGTTIESPLKGRIGTFIGKKHTAETKQLIREKALASKHRRLKKGMVEYNGIWLDSSWELALAQRLDELNIKWIRPDPIEWTDSEGIIHNYFPDFYLTEHDLFLDPKNPQAVKVQRKKLDCLLTQHNNIVIIESLEQCENFIIN